MYIVGLMGTTRRTRYFEDPELQIWFVIAAIGVAIIAVGIAAFLIQIFVSIRNREKLRDTTGDPWNARTLEWSTSSPPPPYNFAQTPIVHDLDAWYDMKSRHAQRPETGFAPIHMPRNTGAGVVLSALALVLGFAMVWYIWWLAAVAAVGLLVVGIGHTFNYDRDYHIPAEEVTALEDQRTRLLAQPAGAAA
jgi:cytochrome o ubiquinol oxidase subunit I